KPLEGIGDLLHGRLGRLGSQLCFEASKVLYSQEDQAQPLLAVDRALEMALGKGQPTICVEQPCGGIDGDERLDPALAVFLIVWFHLHPFPRRNPESSIGRHSVKGTLKPTPHSGVAEHRRSMS